jgi:LmeA-like phospholipid-binding
VNGGAYGAVDDRVTRRRRGGCLRTLVIGVVVLLVLAVAADFIAKAVAQNEAASQIQQQGFPKKPSVTIEGFPFLTQVAAHDIRQVRLSSTDIPEGPVQVSRVSAVLSGVHLNSGFTSGTIDQLSGTVLITYPALASALTSALGPASAVAGAVGLTLSDAGPGEVKASVNLVVESGSATWKVTRLSGQELNIRLIATSGVPASLLSSVSNFTVDIPKLPFGMTIQQVSVTPSGIVGQISGHDLPFGTGG